MFRVSTTPTHALSRRRSQRVLMQVGIRVRGKDAQGKDFEEMTETLAINAHGALILLNVRVVSGAIIHLKHNMTEEEQECHVAFLGPVRSGRAEVGVEFNSPRPTFWRVAFPPEDWREQHHQRAGKSSASGRAGSGSKSRHPGDHWNCPSSIERMLAVARNGGLWPGVFVADSRGAEGVPGLQHRQSLVRRQEMPLLSQAVWRNPLA